MKFIHLRKFRDGDHLLSTGGATIAFEEKPAQKEDEKVVRYFIAKCCDKDVFCKNTGRKVAQGRLDLGRGGIITVPMGLPRHELVEVLKEQYYRDQERFDSQVRQRVR